MIANNQDDITTPLVSAIITTHNRLNLLKRAVDSVLSQTYPNMELIVVDDGSDDGTEEWCEQQSFRYIRIPKGESRGGNYARNLGITASEGKYVVFLDDDDYWLPEKTALQVKLLQEKDCETVYCGRRLEIIENGKVKEYIDQLPNKKYSGDLSKKILSSIPTTTSLMMVSRNALIEIGLFDENLKFWQDYDLMIRLAQRKPFYFVNKILAVYRLNEADPNRLTNKFNGWKEAVHYILNKHKNLFSPLNPWEKLGVKFFISRDAQIRAKSAGLTSKYRKYRILTYLGNGYALVNVIKNGEFDKIVTKLKNKMGQVFSIDSPYALKICRGLEKLHIPAEQAAYKKIHARKSKFIESLIPQSLQKLKTTPASMSGNKISPSAPIYFFWLTGEESMPEIVKMCYIQLKKYAGDHPIIFICKDNLEEIVKLLPHSQDKILKWVREKKITVQYFSDILRSGLIHSQGGIWTDATLFLTKPIDEIILNQSFYTLKRLQKGAYWRFAAQNRWTSFFLSGGNKNKYMEYLFNSLVESIDNYGTVPEYFAIDYILSIGYNQDSEISKFVDNLPAIEPNLGRLTQINDRITDEEFQKTITSSPAFKLNWRIGVNEIGKKDGHSIYNRLKTLSSLE